MFVALGDRVPVLQDVNLRSGRRDPFFEHLVSEESVDECALSGVELANHDQHEELVELADGRGEGRLVVRARVEARQRIAEPSQQVAATVQLALQIGR
jgi:hypothetical protein